MADCINFRIGKAFLAENKWPVSLSDAANDRCYCSNCYAADLESTLVVGGNTYVVPRKYTRIGVRMNEAVAEHRDIWKSWSNCYHGTNIEDAKSAIEHQQLLMPGEKKMDGKEVVALGKALGKPIPGEYVFYTTPSIRYAELPQFTKRYNFTYKENGKNYQIIVVLQCKQKPDSFTVRPTSITDRICAYIPNEELKWVTEQRTAIMPYGLLLRIRPKNPEEQIPLVAILVTDTGVLNINGKTVIQTQQQVSCPHCWHSKNSWRNPKKNQGIVMNCEKCKKTFQPFNCPGCSCFHVKKEYEGVSVCRNDHCQQKLLQMRCSRCSVLNVWSYCAKKQARLVTCLNKTCMATFQLHNCPRCEEAKLAEDFSYKKGVIFKCCKSFQLVNCPHCSGLNVCKNAYTKAGLDGIVQCAFKSCNKKFEQPLQERHKR